MSEAQMREFQRLHERLQSGGTLSVAERQRYDAIVAKWDTEEDAANAEGVRQTRARLASLETEYNSLRQRHDELNAQIAAVEEALAARRAAPVAH